MPNRLARHCPKCHLILLTGAIFDAAEKSNRYGPTLGLNQDAVPDDAIAGYVGMESMWLGDDRSSRGLYRCRRCQTDCLIPIE